MRHPHALMLRYEEMINDFDGWLNRLIHYSGCTITAALQQKLLDNHRKQRPQTENIDRHLRKGIAGDYREKLQPETITELNTLFGGMLGVFGYGEENGN